MLRSAPLRSGSRPPRALPTEGISGAPIVLLRCDALCTLGRPIWLTVEPRSLAILQSELGDNREAETWKKPGDALADAGLIAHQTVGADQGAGLVKGCALVGLRHHPAWCHLLRPLAMGLSITHNFRELRERLKGQGVDNKKGAADNKL